MTIATIIIYFLSCVAVEFVNSAAASGDISLTGGEYTFADESETSLSQTLLTATADGEEEGVECFDIQLSTTLTTAADNIGDIQKAQVCVLDDYSPGKL